MADEWNKDEKSIPVPPAGGAVPNVSMADQNGRRFEWKFTRLSPLVYGFATIAGYFYAKSYYGSFGIDILNYVTPIDLLLISIEQIEDVAPFIFLVVPALLVWIIFGLPTLLLLMYVALVFLLLAPFSIVLAVAAVLGVVIAAVRILAPRLYWLWKAIWATLSDRFQRIGKRIKQIVHQHTKPQGSAMDEGGSPIHVDDDAEAGQKPVVFAAAYQEAMAQSHASKSFQEDRYFSAAKDKWETVEDEWKEAWKWHQKRLDKLFDKRKDGAPNVQRDSDSIVRALGRLWQHFKQLRSKLVRPWVVFVFWVLFPIYVVGAASLSGRYDAEKIHELAERDEQQTSNVPEDDGEQSDYHELFKFLGCLHRSQQIPRSILPRRAAGFLQHSDTFGKSVCDTYEHGVVGVYRLHR